MKNFISLILIVALSPVVIAADIVESKRKKVTMVMVVGNTPYDFGEFIQIKVSPELPECDDSAPTIGVGKLGVTEAGRDQLYSTALAAAVAKNEVRIVYDKSDKNCWVQRIFVHYDS